MPPRSSPMPKGSCYSGKLPNNTNGNSTTAPLLSCGGEDASLEGMYLIVTDPEIRVLRFTLLVVMVTPRPLLWSFFLFSRFLGNIKEAFDKNPALTNLLLDDFFKDAILKSQVNITHAHIAIISWHLSLSLLPPSPLSPSLSLPLSRTHGVRS